MAWWIGLSTCSSRKTPPANASGSASGALARTAPTKTPIAIANAAGKRPSNKRHVHHAAARPGLARVTATKNCHSFRLVIARFVFRSLLGGPD